MSNVSNRAAGERIRVLHVASGDLWAGAEAQVHTLLTHLAKTGACDPLAVLLNEGELARRLRASGIRVEVYDESMLSAVEIVSRLRRLIASDRPDVVHTHRIKENICGAIANVISARAVSVRTVHGAPEHHPRGIRNIHKRLLRTLDSLCARFAQERIIAVSDALGRDLRGQFNPNRVVVIENGVDVTELRSRARCADFREAKPGATHIGIVGRLTPVKRVDLFIGACRILMDRAPESAWQFHVIGDGPLRQDLEALARKNGLIDSITFHGHRSDTPACMYSLDALVMCSDHEGMPMTPLEAMALGTPVVAHDVGGLRDILSSGLGGILTSDHTADGYATAVRTVLKTHRRAETGYPDWLEPRFFAATNAERTLELYRQLIQ